MSENIQLDQRSLEEFLDALYQFKRGMSHQCDKIESGITFSKTFLKDEASIRILEKANAIVWRIRDCIDPASKMLEKVQELLIDIKSIEL